MTKYSTMLYFAVEF